MARTARVAVVIPAFNHEAYVDEAVRSVLDQTFSDFELLIIDDGSGDGTPARCRAWAQRDSRVRFIEQRNAGSHATLNRGVEATTGEIVAVLNSDDRWAPQRLERVVQEMRDPSVRFVVTGVRLIDAQGASVEDPQHWWNRTQRDFREQVQRHGAALGLLHGNYTVSTSNFVFRRSLWSEIGAFRPRRMIPDWDWAVRVAVQDPHGIRYLCDEALLDYRLHGSNAILSQIVRGDLEIARLHRWMLDRLGVPNPAIQALFRAQRDLRRHAAADVQHRLEPLVRQRESEAALLTAQVQEARALLATREADAGRLRDELGVMEGHVREREADVRSREAEVLALSEQLASADRFVRAREREIADLQAQVAAAEALASAAEALVRDRESDVRGLRDQVQAIEGFVADRERDVALLQAQTASLELHLHQREADVAELAQRLAATEGFVRDRERDVALWRAQAAQVESHLRQREAELRRRDADMAELAKRMAATEGFVRDRERDVALWQAQAAQVESHLRRREADVAELAQGLAATEGFVRQREADVAELANRLTIVEGFVRDRERDVSSLQADLATMLGLAQSRQASIEQLEAQRLQLQAMVDEAESSWIWRQVRKLRRRLGLHRL